MAAPTNTFATYNQVGIREDLEDVIYDISPMETYFTSTVSKSKATNRLHDWQTDALDTPATNAFTEGDDFSAQVTNPTTLLRNYTQISRKDFVVSRTSNVVNTAGRKEELARLIVRKGDSLKRDIEVSVLRNQDTTAGSSLSPRVATGVEGWIYTNNLIHPLQSGGTSPAPVAGLISTAATDGTATAFVEADLKSCLQQSWSCGGVVDTIMFGPTLKNKFDAFTGIATRFRNVASKEQADIVAAADVYVSSFGSHKAVLSRYMRASVVFCLDMSTWGLAWLDKMHVAPIAKSGDSEKRMIVAEWTVVAKSPTANTKLTNVT